jgi:hypothetical protein
MYMIKEGDMVMGSTSEGVVYGMVEHIMNEGGTLGVPGSEYSLESMPPENPAMSVRIYEEEDGTWEPTAYSIGMMYKDAEKADINNHSMSSNSENSMIPTDTYQGKAYEGCGCETCKELNVNCDNCPVCQANEMKSDCCPDINKQAPCWDGYVQRGMKPGVNGKPVPNCVPAAKDKALFANFGKKYKKSVRLDSIFR